MTESDPDSCPGRERPAAHMAGGPPSRNAIKRRWGSGAWGMRFIIAHCTPPTNPNRSRGRLWQRWEAPLPPSSTPTTVTRLHRQDTAVVRHRHHGFHRSRWPATCIPLSLDQVLGRTTCFPKKIPSHLHLGDPNKIIVRCLRRKLLCSPTAIFGVRGYIYLFGRPMAKWIGV
jgi:hypothetical protein